MPPEAEAGLLVAALAATGNTSTPHRLMAPPLSRLSVRYRPLPLHTYSDGTTLLLNSQSHQQLHAWVYRNQQLAA